MDSAWRAGFSQPMPAFTQLDSSQNHEDWEEWLRWEPATEATSPEDGTFNSASSKNDSPVQDHLLDFGKLDEEPLIPPRIVGNDELTFDSGDDLLNQPFTFGLGDSVASGFDFAVQSTNLHDLPIVPKLNTNTAAWPLALNDTSEPNIDLSALTNEDYQQPFSAVPLEAAAPRSYQSSESASHHGTSLSANSPDPPKKRGGRKRKAETQMEKSSPENFENGESQDGDDPLKKTSHNVIEKRYRNNLNDKIVELRNSVPSLRAMGRANTGVVSEDLEGLTPAHKLNKATVMAKATEYIRHLEKRNKTMADEMDTLKAQLAKVEAAFGKSRDRQSSMSDNPSPTSERPREASSASQAGSTTFLLVPQDQTRFGQSITQQQYVQQQGQPAYARPPNPPAEAQNQQRFVNGRGGGVMSKVMLGTMAGIMVMEGFSGHEQPSEDTSSRALFSFPAELLKRSADAWINASAAHNSQLRTFTLLKIVLIVGAVAYLLAPLLTSSVRRTQKIRASASLPKAPSLASPVEVRRKAWDTAIQTVWVPKHFLLEVLAVGLKMLQLSLRRLIGSEAFTNITGTNKEEEAARIKAWDIAIDAQLAGGDAQVSYYRLLLTLMESGTLPDSPSRLMQKAVHFRVFFWEVANAGYGNMVGFKQFTEKVGRFYWDSARRLQKELVQAKPNGRFSGGDDVTEPLPDHLARLVELDCDEVLSDEMIQRAWNLAWNKPSAYRTSVNAARDSVVEDHAIRSPLDAVAAWYTNTTIDDTLADVLSDNVSSFDTGYYIGLALSVAPPASGTHVRALAAKAVLSNSNRESNIVVALEALPVLSPTGGINLVNHAPASPDICSALTLAKLISLCSPSAPRAATQRAFVALNSFNVMPSDFSLLTAVAAYRLLRILATKQDIPHSAGQGIEEVAANLRVWVGTDSGIDHEGRGRVVKVCLNVAKQLGGWDERDSGYGSAQPSQDSSPVSASGSRLVIT